MAKALLSWASALLLSVCVVLGAAEDEQCGDKGNVVRGVSVSITGERNTTGDWVTFSAVNDATDKVHVDIKHKITECNGRQMIHIEGSIRGIPKDSIVPKDKLQFDSRCGKNVALTNHGLTAIKLNKEDRLSSIVVTNRPLRNNELFEVTYEVKGGKFGFIDGIGLTTHNLAETGIPAHMNSLSTGTWTLYGPNIWKNGSVIYQDYLKISDYKIGDRVGVMRSNTGAIHFFVNGKDHGPGVSNVPEKVYGAFDMYGYAHQVSIKS